MYELAIFQEFFDFLGFAGRILLAILAGATIVYGALWHYGGHLQEEEDEAEREDRK